MSDRASTDSAAPSKRRRRRSGRGFIREVAKGKKYRVGVTKGVTPMGKLDQWTQTVRGDRTAAEKKLTEMLAAVDENRAVDRSHKLVSAVLDDYAALAAKTHSVSTAALYTHICRRWSKLLGRVPVQQLKPGSVTRGLAELSADKLAPSTIRLYHTVLTNALKLAESDGLILKNPSAGAPGRPKRSRTKAECYATGEAARFLNAARDGVPFVAYALFHVLFHGGLRLSEALALDWSRVDLATGEVRVERQLLRGAKRRKDGTWAPPVFAAPKGSARTPTRGREKASDKARALRLPAETVAVLKTLHVEQQKLSLADGEFRRRWKDGEDGCRGLLFGRTRDMLSTREPEGLGLPIRQCTARALFARVAKAEKLAPLTPHSARHYHATALLAVGTPVADVSRRLGHSDSGVTWSIYVHPQTEAENVGVEKLASVLAAARGSR